MQEIDPVGENYTFGAMSAKQLITPSQTVERGIKSATYTVHSGFSVPDWSFASQRVNLVPFDNAQWCVPEMAKWNEKLESHCSVFSATLEQSTPNWQRRVWISSPISVLHGDIIFVSLSFSLSLSSRKPIFSHFMKCTISHRALVACKASAFKRVTLAIAVNTPLSLRSVRTNIQRTVTAGILHWMVCLWTYRHDAQHVRMHCEIFALDNLNYRSWLTSRLLQTDVKSFNGRLNHIYSKLPVMWKKSNYCESGESGGKGPCLSVKRYADNHSDLELQQGGGTSC